MVLIGCDDRAGLPDQSYTFPTAIVGVPVASQDEGERIKAALATFAQRHDLVRYRPIEEPFFAESNRRDPMQHLERQTMYNPRYPNDRRGFGIELQEYSPQCFVIWVAEWSGVWTEKTLRAFQQINSELVQLTSGRAKLFVPPRPEQNWPAQQNGPERPTYLAELCVRMGFPDPRSAAEAAAQGPLLVNPVPNKTMEPTR
jgi:hypothetical protein